MTIEIEHGIPLPTRSGKTGLATTEIRDALSRMQPGDSVLIATHTLHRGSGKSDQYAAAISYRTQADKMGIKIATRLITRLDDGRVSVRIWRVAEGPSA
jgi:hypothetical protein